METDVASGWPAGPRGICDAGAMTQQMDGGHVGIVGVGHVGMASAAALFHVGGIDGVIAPPLEPDEDQ